MQKFIGKMVELNARIGTREMLLPKISKLEKNLDYFISTTYPKLGWHQ